MFFPVWVFWCLLFLSKTFVTIGMHNWSAYEFYYVPLEMVFPQCELLKKDKEPVVLVKVKTGQKEVKICKLH